MSMNLMVKTRVGKREQVLAKTDGRCAYCGTTLSLENFAIDHVRARRNGGSNRICNLMPACHPCNLAKGPKDLEHYRMYLSAKAVTGTSVFGQSQLLWLKEAGAFPLLGFDRETKFYFEVMA
ncbi:HNH endonuclease [Pseudomonas sp. N40(2020)]|uniref:HNH endonuclease n=1 Tax=Pseudomonas sp. N40(2020) TaxID=2767798 RepID=UPI001656F4AF|nr:HNH endonuclease [Pseudomonas sp. N40(2020)]MBC8994957.1 HNH endonuclease [Pseudomonas sp. N40(2020)]